MPHKINIKIHIQNLWKNTIRFQFGANIMFICNHGHTFSAEFWHNCHLRFSLIWHISSFSPTSDPKWQYYCAFLYSVTSQKTVLSTACTILSAFVFPLCHWYFHSSFRTRNGICLVFTTQEQDVFLFFHYMARVMTFQGHLRTFTLYWSSQKELQKCLWTIFMIAPCINDN